jgi:hypothetical protein
LIFIHFTPFPLLIYTIKMVDQFCSRTVQSIGGIDPLSWINQFAKNAIFDGDKKIVITTADNKTTDSTVSQSAIVFSDLRIAREENPNETGGARAILGSPLPCYVDTVSAMMAQDGFTKHIFPSNCCIVPLGCPINKEARIVINQCGMDWVSCMQRKIASHEHHNINMYMSVLQSIVWAYVNEEDRNSQRIFYDMLINITKTVFQYLRSNPVSRDLVSAVNMTPMARDMIQYALSFVLNPESSFDVNTKWKLLEIALKRTNKYSEKQKSKPDFCKTPPLGFIACLWVIPSIQTVLEDERKMNFMMDELDKKIVGLTEIVEKIKSIKDVDERNVEFLMHFMEYSEMSEKINKATVTGFYLFCTNKETLITPFPLEGMGYTKPIDTPFLLSRFDIKLTHGETIKDQAVPTELRVKEKTVLVSSRSPNFFTGFNLTEIGCYALKPYKLDFAFPDKTNFSEIRFLGGNVINAVNKEYVSTIGKRYKKGSKWYFETVDIEPLDMSKHIFVEINDAFFLIVQDSKLYSILKATPDEALLIGFKNVQSELTKEAKSPEEVIKAQEEKKRKDHEEKERIDKEKAEKDLAMTAEINRQERARREKAEKDRKERERTKPKVLSAIGRLKNVSNVSVARPVRQSAPKRPTVSPGPKREVSKREVRNGVEMPWIEVKGPKGWGRKMPPQP